MSLSFRYGWQAARHALGWVWPVTAAFASLICIGIAAVLEARAIGSAESARQTELYLLQGATFGLVVPLFVFSMSCRLDHRLDHLMSASWVRHGADRRVFGLGRIAFPSVVAWALGIVAGGLALGLSNASSDPALAVPLGLTTNPWALTWIAALGAVSYTACLGLAQLLAGSGGLALFLVGDWLLGSGIGVAALPWPRSHLRALLGGSPVLGMTELQASACLAAVTLVATLLFARRLPR
jgi:hypothetical protein